jgi:archaellum biogenesis ATPase FlaH
MGLYRFDIEDARRFAQEQGIRTFMRGDELQFKECPYCRYLTTDKNTFSINTRTGQFKCLRSSCGVHGNMITLAKDFDFSLGTEADEYYNPRRKFRDLRRFPRPITKPAAIEYLESRGISAEVAERYHITTKKDNDNILAFPFYDDKGQLQFVKYRKTDFDPAFDDNKEWCEKNCQPILFGMEQCNLNNSTLIMTEGQIDSLSVVEAGLENAVSVPNGAKGFTWVPYCYDWLENFDTLIVFGDYEKGEITLLKEMSLRFSGTVKHVRPEDYLGCKDANDILRKFGKGAIIDAVNNAEAVISKRIKKLSEVKRKNVTDIECMDTGLSVLNKVIGGFYMGSLIILTGERGFGKSTLGSQFLTFAINQKYPVFAYSGELNDWRFKEWMERQIAGGFYINKLESNLGYKNYILDGQYESKLAAWYDEYCLIYDNKDLDEDEEETETLLETIENAIKQGGCRVIFIDNLMTAMTDDLSADLYRQQTRFVKGLVRLKNIFDVLIILVVHPRKSQGYNFRNDDVAGSSNITNLADVVLNYTMPERTENDPDPCDRLLQVTKNRINGNRDSGIKTWFQESSKRISDDRFGFDWEFDWNNDFEDTEESDEIPF